MASPCFWYPFLVGYLAKKIKWLYKASVNDNSSHRTQGEVLIAYLVPEPMITASRSELQVLLFLAHINGTIVTPRLKLHLGFRLGNAKKVVVVGERLIRQPCYELIKARIAGSAVDFKRAPKKTVGPGGQEPVDTVPPAPCERSSDDERAKFGDIQSDPEFRKEKTEDRKCGFTTSGRMRSTMMQARSGDSGDGGGGAGNAGKGAQEGGSHHGSKSRKSF